MSDPETIRKNLSDYNRQLLLGRRRRGSDSPSLIPNYEAMIEELVALAKAQHDVSRGYFAQSSWSDFVMPAGPFFTISEERAKPDIEKRVDDIERKLETLEIDSKQLEALVSKILLDEFSTLPYIRRMFLTKTPEGFSLLVSYSTDDLKRVLQDIFLRKKAVRGKYPGTNIDVVPVSDDKLVQNNWYRTSLIFSRE
jgi:hypothetical protein